jgi:hypothetical protein
VSSGWQHRIVMSNFNWHLQRRGLFFREAGIFLHPVNMSVSPRLGHMDMLLEIRRLGHMLLRSEGSERSSTTVLVVYEESKEV